LRISSLFLYFARAVCLFRCGHCPNGYRPSRSTGTVKIRKEFEEARKSGGSEKPNSANSSIVIEVCLMKEYECVQVNHHKNVGKAIQEWQEKGWRLHSYAVAGSPTAVNHYLLFEKGE
jgi:hypothetical protein